MDNYPENYRVYERVAEFINDNGPGTNITVSSLLGLFNKYYYKDHGRVKDIIKMLIRLSYLEDMSEFKMRLYSNQPPRRYRPLGIDVNLGILKKVEFPSLARLKGAHSEYIKNFNKK